MPTRQAQTAAEVDLDQRVKSLEDFRGAQIRENEIARDHRTKIDEAVRDVQELFCDMAQVDPKPGLSYDATKVLKKMAQFVRIRMDQEVGFWRHIWKFSYIAFGAIAGSLTTAWAASLFSLVQHK